MAYFNRTKITDSTGVLVNPASEESLILLRQLLTLLKPLGMVTGGGSNRLSIDINSSPTTLSTVTTITTVSTIANQTNIGNVNAFSLVKDTARNAYNNGIRSHLSFT